MSQVDSVVVVSEGLSKREGVVTPLRLAASIRVIRFVVYNVRSHPTPAQACHCVLLLTVVAWLHPIIIQTVRLK